ncbi:MAG: translation initiation factor [Muribaculaceae bacterium]|nr:translation initiation factor [Muribaculaceae bacterium]
MKSNDLQSALQAFLQNNPDLPQGEEPAAETPAKSKSVKLIVRLETKGRKGKPATIISGLSQLEPERVGEIAADLKKRLATGGSYRDDEILIQGDRCKDVTDALRAMGFRTN